MKKTKILAAFTSAALITSVFGAISLSANAATSYTAANGSTTSFDKYLVMDEGANVPNVSFEYTIAAGTAQTFSAADKTIAVYAGPEPEKIAFSGTGISDVEPTDRKFEIAFAAGDSTTLTADMDSSDYVKNLDDFEKYAKKTAQLDFSAVSFDEPGIYRYIITETQGTAQGITYDADNTRVLDVYVEDVTTDAAFPELKVSSYILHANADTISIDQTTYGSDGQVIIGGTEKKSQGFTNEYATHDLTFSKAVSGNQASKDKYFAFKLNIANAAAGTVYTVSYADDGNAATADGSGDVSISANPNNATTVIASDVIQPATLTADADGKVNQIFYLQHGQKIAIRGLADGTTYTITDGKEDYTAAYVTTDDRDVTVEKLDVAANSDGISKDVVVDFTNTRDGILPTGVILAAAGPAILAAVVLGGMIILIVKNRKREAEEE